MVVAALRKPAGSAQLLFGLVLVGFNAIWTAFSLRAMLKFPLVQPHTWILVDLIKFTSSPMACCCF
ncbi:hypothetical protein RHGRI_025604 [Rhododendron griersonianum]|uniref:Uncharacterized protein n=1 Tax=Rhododendron griersonianum TaxID=479676 RepID=A0AAV6IQB9_9ERIC|nr:hypothetical protein RHGRI_025604 [Rhododendron griersonianum]